MTKTSRQLSREIGSALGVLALLVLTLLSPVHAAAEIRASLGDHDAAIYCLGDPQNPDSKPHFGLACDLCATAHVAKIFDTPGAAASVVPPRAAHATGLWPRLEPAPDGSMARLPHSHGPPFA